MIAPRSIPWGTTVVATASAVVSSVPALGTALVLDPSSGLASLPTWLTSPLVHHTPSHLFWDVLAFLVLGAWLEARSRRMWATTVMLSAAAVSGWMALTMPSGGVFGGLSGVDAAFVGATVVLLARSADRVERWGAALLGIGFVAKLATELTGGDAVFAGGGGVIHVPAAHVIGAAVGAAIAGLAQGLRTVPMGRSNASGNTSSACKLVPEIRMCDANQPLRPMRQ